MSQIINSKILYRVKQNYEHILPYCRMKDSAGDYHILNRRYIPVAKLANSKMELLPINGTERRSTDGPHWVQNVQDKSYYFGGGFGTAIKHWQDNPERLLQVYGIAFDYREIVTNDDLVQRKPWPPLGDETIERIQQWVMDNHDRIKKVERAARKARFGGYAR
ncbi:MAG: hypothetical protein HN842_02065 [Gammaproteobacteria bacterium]|jgi:hypothetical protein|nr:hypothetical protein [Gammaproteobacteria bacterium]